MMRSCVGFVAILLHFGCLGVTLETASVAFNSTTGVEPVHRLEFLSHVSVEVYWEGLGYVHLCSGVLVGPSTVLTIGACVIGSSDKDFQVVAGKYHLKLNGSQEEQEQTRRVKEVSFHPNFTRTPLDYDLAILNVDEPFNETQAVTPEELRRPTGNVTDSQVCFTVGWGLDEFFPGHMLPLQKGPTTLMTKAACRETLGGRFPDRFHCSYPIQYGVRLAFAVHYNLGGSLWCKDGDSNKTLVGLTSLQIRGEIGEIPILFSDIDYVFDGWMNDS